MQYAICKVPAAPVRRTANHRSEMVNQLLFGESVKIGQQKGKWRLIISIKDGYEGWVTENLLAATTAAAIRQQEEYATSSLLCTLQTATTLIQLPMGATLPEFDGQKGFSQDEKYTIKGKWVKLKEQHFDPALLTHLAFQWLHAPYLWGGKTLMGVDCSGYVQTLFKLMGIFLPCDAKQQALKGRKIRSLAKAQTGDLAFFDDKDEIVHVGILLGNISIIHAAGRVRVDTITDKGIVNSETGELTHRLKLIRSVR